MPYIEYNGSRPIISHRGLLLRHLSQICNHDYRFDPGGGRGQGAPPGLKGWGESIVSPPKQIENAYIKLPRFYTF